MNIIDRVIAQLSSDINNSALSRSKRDERPAMRLRTLSMVKAGQLSEDEISKMAEIQFSIEFGATGKSVHRMRAWSRAIRYTDAAMLIAGMKPDI